MSDVMRVYLPATLPLLRMWCEQGSISPAPMTGYAVTPGLREWYAEGEGEELENAAALRAARASLRLLVAVSTEPRRVVVAVDAAAVTVRDDLDEGAVIVTEVLSWTSVAAGLVDDLGAEADVRAAAAVIDAADMGDDDAEFAVGTAEDQPLLWFARQELVDL